MGVADLKKYLTVGFFASLTLSQQAKALAYRGEENHGEPEYARNRPPKPT